jgi:hypothetical protein
MISIWRRKCMRFQNGWSLDCWIIYTHSSFLYSLCTNRQLNGAWWLSFITVIGCIFWLYCCIFCSHQIICSNGRPPLWMHKFPNDVRNCKCSQDNNTYQNNKMIQYDPTNTLSKMFRRMLCCCCCWSWFLFMMTWCWGCWKLCTVY